MRDDEQRPRRPLQRLPLEFIRRNHHKTGLSDLLEGALSHDQITRFLSQQRFDSKTLWQLVKPMVRAIADEAGVLIFDDTIQEKPYTDEDELQLLKAA